jgi:hypothetical protein
MKLAGPTWKKVQRDQLVSELVSLYPDCFSEEDVYRCILQDEDIQLYKYDNDNNKYLSRVVHPDFDIFNKYMLGTNFLSI